MYHRYILFVFLSLLSPFAFSQNETKKWYFGAGAGLDFNTSPPTILNNGSLNNINGCATISDASGSLLFYTDGQTVWDRTHAIMPNGSGLSGLNDASQSCIIVKQPGSNDIYYIFTTGGFSGLNYTTIDMSLNGGLGDVTVSNTPLNSSWYPQKISATLHCNGIDVWVVSRDGGWDGGAINNPIDFQSFLVTAAGVNTVPITSPANNWNTTGGWSFYDIGCMKISPNGKKLGLAIYNYWSNSINNIPNFELYDFDASTGVVSNSLALNSTTNQLNNYGYGCEFSPDGSKFYGSSPYYFDGVNTNIGIMQWDLCAGLNNDIVASQYTIAANLNPNDLFGSMQLAPDGKIYIAKKGQTVLDVINFPDLAGAASNYVSGGQSISPNVCGEGLPNFMSSYFLPLAPPRIIPQFTYNANYTTSCLTASFTAPTLAAPCPASGYSVSNILWLFGDTASGAANTSAVYKPTHIYPRPGTYTVQLIYNYVCGADTLTQPIIITGPSLTVTASAVSCAGLGTATVSANGGVGPYSYTWNPTAQTSPFATGISPGNYSITLLDNGNSCSFTETVAIVSTVSFVGVISSSSVSCHGASTGTASIALSNGTGVSNYFWTNGTITQTTSIATNLTAGAYTISVIDAITSCSLTQSFFINQPPPLNLNVVSAKPTICAGNVASFTATSSGGTPGYTYSWIGGALTNTHAVTVNLEGTFVYSVSSADANNCLITQTISVTVPKAASIITVKPKVCLNENINLQGFGAEVYEWTGPYNFSSKSQNVFFKASNIAYAGVYTLVAKDAFGCLTTTSTAIVIDDLPKAVIVSSATNGCVPYCANFSLKKISSAALTNFSWQIDNQIDTTGSFRYCVSKPGSFQLACRFTDVTTTCSNNAVYRIEGYPAPIGNFDYSPQKPIADVDRVLFTDNSSGNGVNGWHWYFMSNDGYKSTTQNASYIFENAGNFPVALIVKNSWGCSDTVVKTIYVEDDFNVFVPSAFTPNGDGNNDFFQPKLTGITKYRLTVYNQWGQKIFETTNFLEAWDGTLKGEGCKSEVYVWIISAAGFNGKTKNMNGFVTLYR